MNNFSEFKGEKVGVCLVNWPSDGMEMGKMFIFLFHVNSSSPFINLLGIEVSVIKAWADVQRDFVLTLS